MKNPCPGRSRRYGSRHVPAAPRHPARRAREVPVPNRRRGRCAGRRGAARAPTARSRCKPGQLVEPEADLIVSEGARFVSRGGIKLENALEALGIEVAGRDCLDVGASTGGFTDCLLQRGAARVAAVDVAHGELDWGLRNDPRVTRARGAQRALAGRRRTFPSLPRWRRSTSRSSPWPRCCPRSPGRLSDDGEILALVKPQFELGRERVGKGGVVRDAGDSARGAGRASRSGAVARPCGARLCLLGAAGPEGKPARPSSGARGRASSLDDVEAAIREVEP